jgi:hypothetical protein
MNNQLFQGNAYIRIYVIDGIYIFGVNMFKVPVVFIIFNRPELTKRVFSKIANVKPSKLLVIADGPRKTYPDDIKKCAAARAIIDDVDWDCKVLKNYSDTNMGCKYRISSGLDWVFDIVEEAIILEDDCLPDHTFFRFCEELLEKYKDNEQVAMISGDNFQFGTNRTEYSYYFSRYPHVWGWASWRRVWKQYDVEIKLWPDFKKKHVLNSFLYTTRSILYWTYILNNVYHNKINTWDYQLTFACWNTNKLTIIPSKNLVSNIGFGADSVHTKNKTDFYIPVSSSMEFPLIHPIEISSNMVADMFTEQIMYSGKSIISRIKNMMLNILRTF